MKTFTVQIARGEVTVNGDFVSVQPNGVLVVYQIVDGQWQATAGFTTGAWESVVPVPE